MPLRDSRTTQASVRTTTLVNSGDTMISTSTDCQREVRLRIRMATGNAMIRLSNVVAALMRSVRTVRFW